jgi:hypothetical protein
VSLHALAGPLNSFPPSKCGIATNPILANVIMFVKATHLAAFAILLFFLSHPTICDASEEEHEEEHHEDEAEPHLERSAVWGYSFLFTFLGCLPSAFAIIICVWAKLEIADKVITALMAFASGVSSACQCQQSAHM